MTTPKLSKHQSQLLAAIFESFGGDPLDTTSGVEMEDSEERSALALERKGLVRVDGDIYLTDAGVAFGNGGVWR